MTDDPRLFAPATARNRDPIWTVLAPELPTSGLVLEIAAGSGEHSIHFARLSMPTLHFQPTDPDAAARASIDAWAARSDLANVRPALALDAAADDWTVTHADVVVCINMIHISPWRAAEGLMAGAARVLAPGGVLFLYGPYKERGVHTAPSNEAFDASLRARNPEWGVRDLDDVKALAEREGLDLAERVVMPANNLSVVFSRR
jgi:SAM-dependent methyltransferase